jgi:hypothetical protein
MKTAALSIAFLAAFPLVASADVTKEEIKKLAAAGISEDVIVSYIRKHGPVAPLSADDLVELKKAGAGEKVLAACVNAPAPEAPRASAPRTSVSAPVSYAYEEPVYVYSSYRPYSWYGYGYGYGCWPYTSWSFYPYYSYGRSYGWPYYRSSIRWGWGLGRCW